MVIRRPRTIIIVCAAVALGLGLVALTSPYDLSFTGLLDPADPEVMAYRDGVRTFGANSTLVLLLEGEPEDLAQVADRLAAELPLRSEVKTVTPPADPEWVIERAPWLWPAELYGQALAAAALPIGEAPPAGVSAGIKAAEAYIRHLLRPTDRAALIQIELKSDPLDMAMGGGDFRKIEKATREIVAREGGRVSAEFTGIGAVGAQDQNAVFTRVKILTPLTLLAVLILLRGVERRLSRVALAGLALGGSVAIAFGGVGLLLGKLSITATFFGMLLLGLGIDFAIHLLVALRDGRAHGMEPEAALRAGLEKTGTAIVLGGVSTGLAFGMVVVMPEPGARDMGLTAVFGLLGALALMLSFLPASWLLLERRHAASERPVRFDLPGLRPLVGFSLAHPRAVVALGLALTVWGLAGLPRYRVESDLRKIISRDVPAFAVEERLMELFDVSPTVYLAPVDSLEEARRLSGRLQALPEIARVQSPSDWILADAAGRGESMARALADAPRKGNPETKSLRARLERAAALGPITLDILPPALRSGMIGPNGELAVQVIPKESLLDAIELGGQIDRLRAIAPSITGMPVVAKIMILGRRDYVPIMIPSILAVVTLVLSLTFRNMRDVVLALLPVLVGAFTTFGIFCWLGLQFSVITAIVVPVILGLGVDDGIHVVERLRRIQAGDDASIHEAVEGVGRAIFLTTATTMVSFFGLLFSNHAGMESIAHFMLIGMPLCFLTSVTVLPAAAKLTAGRAGQPRVQASRAS